MHVFELRPAGHEPHGTVFPDSPNARAQQETLSAQSPTCARCGSARQRWWNSAAMTGLVGRASTERGQMEQGLQRSAGSPSGSCTAGWEGGWCGHRSRADPIQPSCWQSPQVTARAPLTQHSAGGGGTHRSSARSSLSTPTLKQHISKEHSAGCQRTRQSTALRQPRGRRLQPLLSSRTQNGRRQCRKLGGEGGGAGTLQGVHPEGDEGGGALRPRTFRSILQPHPHLAHRTGTAAAGRRPGSGRAHTRAHKSGPA